MSNRKRLKKQPKIRRAKATGTNTIPRIVIPKAAKKRRRRNQRHFRLPTAALKSVILSARWLSLALLGVSIFAIIQIGQDSSYYLSSIPVSGNVAVPASEIVATSGLAGGHIFSADPSTAAERIGQIPGVISVTVQLNWPNQVSIEIQEDEPIAVWKNGSDTYWIAESGEMIPARHTASGLLTIEYEEGAKVEFEDYIADDVLVGALQLKELRPNIDHLYYEPGNGLSYQDGRGWRVYFGSGADMGQKLVIYETIVDDLLRRSITPKSISVRNYEKPYYRMTDS